MGAVENLRTADGFTLSAYRAKPTGAKKRGAVVILQEIFGVNHHIRNVTDHFAAAGYESIAPALFDRAQRDVDLGYDGPGVAAGRDLRGQVKLEDTLADMAAAIAAVSAAGPVAVIGYCWGGSLAFLAATRLKGIACAVGYYGGMIAGHADEKPQVPVLLHFGEKDEGIPMADVDIVRKKRPDVEIHTYPAGHGFSCDERASFDPASHEKALQRTLAFLAKHLGA
ncbi:MAG TPA: dienelactone hydrolase family protein [Dongiaceae bacterium]|nr:dienelactone hydrolase family protein [Dongiaceae bacterium]